MSKFIIHLPELRFVVHTTKVSVIHSSSKRQDDVVTFVRTVFIVFVNGQNGCVSHDLWFLATHTGVVVHLFHHLFERVSWKFFHVLCK